MGAHIPCETASRIGKDATPEARSGAVEGVVPGQCLAMAVEQPRLTEQTLASKPFESVDATQQHLLIMGVDPRRAFAGSAPVLGFTFLQGDRETAARKLAEGRYCLVPDHFHTQTGLGAVHGLAAPLGAFFPIPHGVACGTLVATATAANIAALEARAPDSPALPKYAEIGRRFAMQKGLNGADARAYLVDTLHRWEEQLALPRLGAYRVASADFSKVVANARGSSMKTNPVALTDAELAAILAART